jgi:hypothetical protein
MNVRNVGYDDDRWMGLAQEALGPWYQGTCYASQSIQCAWQL